MLLPSKLQHFPVLDSDVSVASGTPDAERIPECVGVNQVQSMMSYLAVYATFLQVWRLLQLYAG